MRQFLFVLIFDHYAIFIKIIDDFCQHMRIKKIRTKKMIFNLTFVVDENKKLINCTFSFRNQQQKKFICICEKKNDIKIVDILIKNFVQKNKN